MKEKVEKILNKWQIRGKNKYLVWWKGFTAKSDTWKRKENLENTKEAVEGFEREYRKDIEDVRRQEKEDNRGIFARGELPRIFMAKKLFGWSDKRYNKEYWRRLEKNWRRYKGGQMRGRRTIC